MKDQNFLFLQAASSAFLCSPLPDAWEEMNEDTQQEFLVSNATSHFEYMSADQLYGLIDDHAETFRQTVKKTLLAVKDGLIEAAIEATLSSDMNEVDLDSMAAEGKYF